MEEKQYAVEMIGICKSFGMVQANKDINFHVQKGEIHALVGENGAGKTTLMNILFGVFPPTSGHIRINGEDVTITSPNKAIRLGLGMVHQHFELVPNFTVAENICIGHEPLHHLGMVDRAEMIRYTQELSDTSGLQIDPTAYAGKLPVGLRQRVEILKAISRGADILILDEPTAVLTPLESSELFTVLKRMSAQGKTVIIITHKLKEVMEIADHITVLSRGETKGTLRKCDTNENELASLMMGKAASFPQLEKAEIGQGEPLLRVEGLCVRNTTGLERLHELSFSVRPGEIMTIAGVEGNGQSELIDALLGFLPATAGRIMAGQTELTHLNVKKRRSYCSYIPEDRMTTGLDLAASVHDNIIAGLHCNREWKKGLCINYRKTRELAKELIQQYAIRTDGYEVEASALSGGNQQKIIVAREMNFGNKILIIAQPSRGVDIGATQFIHKQILKMRNEGCAIVLISTDLDEVLALSDVIKVLFEGKIVATLRTQDVTPEELGLYMTGAKRMEGDGTDA